MERLQKNRLDKWDIAITKFETKSVRKGSPLMLVSLYGFPIRIIFKVSIRVNEEPNSKREGNG